MKQKDAEGKNDISMFFAALLYWAVGVLGTGLLIISALSLIGLTPLAVLGLYFMASTIIVVVLLVLSFLTYRG